MPADWIPWIVLALPIGTACNILGIVYNIGSGRAYRDICRRIERGDFDAR